MLLLLDSSDRLQPGLRGAIFLYAHCHSVFGARLLSDADRLCRFGVFGPNEERTQIALAAVSYLLRNGAALVRLTFPSERQPSHGSAKDGTPMLNSVQKRKDELWTLQSHELFVDLTLYPDLDLTLAQLGRRTRRNMREVMRRCVVELGCTFSAQASLRLDEFLEMNSRSARPSSYRVA